MCDGKFIRNREFQFKKEKRIPEAPDISSSVLRKTELFIQLGELIGVGGYAKVYRVNIYSTEIKNTPGGAPPNPPKIGHVGGVSQLAPMGPVKDSPPGPPEDRGGPVKVVAALKYIERSLDTGLNSLLEAYITKYIKNIHLIQAMKVDIDEQGHFQIVQPIALGDACTIVRKKGNLLPLDILRRWCWHLVCAVAHLHSNGIVHADIKASNVLVFSSNSLIRQSEVRGPADHQNVLPPGPSNCITSGNPVSLPDSVPEVFRKTELAKTRVSLADYSLSIPILNPDLGTRDINRRMSYTETHRPLEVWKGEGWSYAADIWALGCTFYELGYQSLLFPHQKGAKSVDDANIKVLEDWAHSSVTPSSIETPSSYRPAFRRTAMEPRDLRYPQVPPLPEAPFGFHGLAPPKDLLRAPPTMDHKVFSLSPHWVDSKMRVFNEMLLGTLTIDPHARLTVWDLIDHPFFEDLKREEDLPPPRHREFPRISYPYTEVSKETIEEAKKISPDPQILEIGLSLYQRSRHCESLEKPRLLTCMSVAHKILYRTPLPGSPSFTSVQIQDEILLCRVLDYKFLSHEES